jgi:hypothetical protein
LDGTQQSRELLHCAAEFGVGLVGRRLLSSKDADDLRRIEGELFEILSIKISKFIKSFTVSGAEPDVNSTKLMTGAVTPPQKSHQFSPKQGLSGTNFRRQKSRKKSKVHSQTQGKREFSADVQKAFSEKCINENAGNRRVKWIVFLESSR